ncbi:alkylated DNA repair protein alkB-like protein 8 [Pyrus ussuriensis x Pyrus communis]|uniref:Alkylated DNA repair protein alkB-like 8 n=1 Tax=Pyrus ussuriensis x Pyrus communis TaxID=2448454 RepID=A0A5N5GUW9_9ROSA|nr:alkylated DNA repair protein alkB-like 8 [Pyrus ussuriensis x Pyrus communis]KAB2617218.1 alkylated DNA repair protein alkB-like protein 8 [Pyrus ussuriensis x Pyrus communis]
MFGNVLKGIRRCYLSREAFRLPTVIIGSVSYSGIFNSGGESHILQFESASESRRHSSLNVKFTPQIEKKYVHHVYDAVAPHFSSTRFAKWPKVANFLSSLPSGSLVLDAGCGNGKYLGFNPDCFFIGCDISAPLIKICADRGHQVSVADAVDLPYRTGFGDAVLSIPCFQ